MTPIPEFLFRIMPFGPEKALFAALILPSEH
jgi:hypothetical protein